MRMIAIAALFALIGCAPPPETEDGCPRLVSEVGRAYTQSCIAAYHEEKARQAGQPVTRCYETSTGMSCTTY